ncbi:MAG: sigma-70 family RNA polymerase sigma factor [Bacteroidetes bacterium]|nr:MAG: sigma-70 family RNA polymerase sigma factor [Bacteroidota bacterium]
MTTLSLTQPFPDGASRAERTSRSTRVQPLSAAAAAALPDTELWQAFKAGARTAYAELYERYFSELYAYGLKIIRNEAQTQDCLCDFFLYLWDHREGLADLEQVKYYLLKAFRHRAIRHLKKRQNLLQREQRYTAEEVRFQFAQTELEDESDIERLRKTYTAALLNQLSERQREIVFLRYYENLTIKEIAAVLDLKEQSVLNHLQRIFKKLRAANPSVFPEVLAMMAMFSLYFV